MNILSCVACSYYGSGAVTYEYISFVSCLERMGHTVQALDQALEAAREKAAFNDRFLALVKTRRFDCVIVLPHEDEFDPNVLDEAKKYTRIIAWNTDDDWRWQDYSRHWYPHFTSMVTTYRSVWEANRQQYPGLLLNQWGCTGEHDGSDVSKTIPVSFVGYGYGERLRYIEVLRGKCGLQAWGRNVYPKRTPGLLLKKALLRLAGRSLKGDTALDDQAAVKAVMNKSRIVFTPLENSRGTGMQIKARVFDMGLSGAMMLASRNPDLYEFYEPGKEYVEYDGLDDCVDKARYYLKHENERVRIAGNYYARTRKQHLWEHRFTKLFADLGLK